jgi:hypothetical protein
LIVDFLEQSLSDLADHKRARAATRGIVEAPSPWIPHPERPDFRQHGGVADERVVWRHHVAAGVAVRDGYIDAQHLSKKVLRILREVVRIAAGPAIAHAEVEKPVRSEDQVAAVVIGEWMLDELSSVGPDKIRAARRDGEERVHRIAQKPCDDNLTLRIGEIHEEATAGRVVRRKREAEQALLTAGNDGRRQIQEVRGDDAADDRTNAPPLLDDELHVRLCRVLDERDR